jgi:hypothetical protein
VDINLIRRFSVILKTIVSGCAVDPEKFGDNAFAPAQLYVQLYPSYTEIKNVEKITTEK